MDTKFEFGQEASNGIVYVRPVAAVDLPKGVREQVGEAETVYSVHSEAGEQLALVKDRKLAFALARQNSFAPVSVH